MVLANKITLLPCAQGQPVLHLPAPQEIQVAKVHAQELDALQTTQKAVKALELTTATEIARGNGAVPPDDDVGEGDDGIAARVAPIAGGWSYLGCFNDNPQRTLDCDPRDYYAGNMSNEKCVAYCDSKGFKLAGTEYHRECWCGNVFQNAKRLPDMQCRMVCDGNPTELCGGSWALTVYSKDGTAVNRPADTNEAGSYGGTSGEKQARGMYDANGSENQGPTPITTLVTAARPASFAPEPQATGLPSGPRLFTAKVMGV
ncbi:uncharacterized protein VDAG_06040 [Verticillium dahliae VdLs.17]|uniref:WSC domain-containing protein n=1 Tax=Verticillium dahliae (strain VdLs.17 / ATCC MYA-4575 / FGSC 10137) TaxID=498257 RepID=G2X899_VERDV|nr:uncharacterized protein VDAG_06040 [Verticillium dahliae VdLs.17]EGY15186.1 hypothetical protein VDAG_06040 [Verticillium dahliae VdLs.17]KAF3358917.1 hypothetical protein VdG1_02479 [Verticillium dahliae VDG1]